MKISTVFNNICRCFQQHLHKKKHFLQQLLGFLVNEGVINENSVPRNILTRYLEFKQTFRTAIAYTSEAVKIKTLF